ncbi:MAG: SDR family NAD(P)-dependent oxidoreductase, partial [Alphaproteobacteria bacterium]|nr:SDR family NAD(P)-dependent oxidoreductase [Alphaproteobacteria bacterium]
MRGLKDQNIIVTGAASGIGRAIARRLGEEGAVVGIFDINTEGANEIAGEITGAGGRAHAYTVDVTSYDAVSQGVTAFEADAGPVDGLVNNAGWDRSEPFLQTDDAVRRKVVDLNLYGPINMCHVVLAGMAERGRGRVVSISSDAGRVGSSGEAVYSACKGGIIAMTKTLAREMARTGITLNTICPGPTDTPLLADVPERLREALTRAVPMRRLAQP